MRALVTGGAGFIGSHVVDALVENDSEVWVLDDLSSGKRENVPDGVSLIEASITDQGAVREAFAAAKPDVVMHLAAQIDVRKSIADPLFDLSVNVAGTINLLEQAREAGGCRLIFASTGGAIYGEGDGLDLPLREDANCRPDAHYGQSKLTAEGYLALYARLYGVETVSLRLGNVYGPRQDPHGEAGVVAIYSGAMLGDGTPVVFGDGEQTRDYVFVGDVAQAFLAAAQGPPGGPFNIGTGRETTVVELGRLIADAHGTSFKPDFAPARPGEVQRIAIDPARANEELGWSAEHDLERGLEITARSFQEAARPG